MTALQKHEQRNRTLQFLKECFNLSLNEPFSASFNERSMSLTVRAEELQKYYYRINSCFEIEKIRKEDFIQKSALKILENKDWADCDNRDERDLEWSMILNHEVNIKIIDPYKEQSEEEFLTLLKFLHNNDMEYMMLDVKNHILEAFSSKGKETAFRVPYKCEYERFFDFPNKVSPIRLEIKPYLKAAVDHQMYKNLCAQEENCNG